MISHIAVLLPQLSTLMYMERLEEREAVIRSFTVPQIWCAFFLFLLVSLLNTQTHMHTHTPAHTRTHAHKHTHTQTPQHVISPPAQTSHPPPPSQFRLILPSPLQLRHPRETNSDCSSTPSWHVGQGRWSPFRFSATTSLPPSLLPCRCPLAASQHFLNMPSVTAG